MTKKKKAILAHIDTMTNISSLSNLFNLLSTENTVAHLSGGDFSSQTMCMDIVEILEKYHIKIENTDLINNHHQPASFAIDARNGKIYSPITPAHLHKTDDINLRIQLAGLQFDKSPLRQYYPQKIQPVAEQTIKNENEKQMPKDTSSLLFLDYLPEISLTKKSQMLLEEDLSLEDNLMLFNYSLFREAKTSAISKNPVNKNIQNNTNKSNNSVWFKPGFLLGKRF